MIDPSYIRPEVHPLDYLVARYGHPTTWKLEQGVVLGATIQQGKVALEAEIPISDHERVITIMSQKGEPFWETLIPANKTKRCALCLQER